MQSFILRREPFGGILAQRNGSKVKFLNHSGFEITYGIAKGWQADCIIKHIKSKYKVADYNTVKADIHKFQQMLLNVEEWDSDDLSFWDNSRESQDFFSIPTLSAPLDLHWEITGRCNLYCRHCYNESTMKSNEPSLTQIRSVINELHSTKLRNITISGGEPLICSDLQTILEWIRPLTLVITLSTNGTLIDEHNIVWLSDLIDGVNLSLDASDKYAYEKFRGRKESFEKCLRGFRLLVKQDIPIAIQTTISRFNIEHLDELANLVVTEGATSWIVRLPIDSGRANENESDFLSREELVEKEPFLSEIRDRYQPKLEELSIGINFMWSYKEPYSCVQQNDTAISCAAGTVLGALLADGSLAPCPLFANTDFKSKPVWNNNFLEQWRNARCMQSMRRLRLNQIQQCYYCKDFKEKCSAGCRAKAYLSGGLFSPDPDCGYTNLRQFIHS